MRILIVLRSLESDNYEGVETRMCIRELLERNIDVGAMYIESRPEFVINHPGLHPLPVFWPDWNDIPKIEAIIRKFKPDMAHIVACWIPFHTKVAGILHRLGIPYAMEPCGHLNPVHLDHRFFEKPSTLLQKIKRRVYQRFVDLPMLKHAAIIRTLSDFEADDINSRFGLKSRTIVWGYNPEWITAVRLKREACTHPVRFLFIGRVDIFQKGLDLVLDAVVLLNKAGQGGLFNVVIAGKPVNESTARITNRLEQEGLTNVKLAPPVFGDEKLELIAESDVFLHPSRFEGIAKMAREASGAGLAVIASKEGNYGETAQQNGFGSLTRLSAADIAEAMSVFIKNPALALQMGASGVEFAKKWSWARVAGEVEKLYSDVLETSSKL